LAFVWISSKNSASGVAVGAVEHTLPAREQYAVEQKGPCRGQHRLLWNRHVQRQQNKHRLRGKTNSAKGKFGSRTMSVVYTKGGLLKELNILTRLQSFRLFFGLFRFVSKRRNSFGWFESNLCSFKGPFIGLLATLTSVIVIKTCKKLICVILIK
jgi:hypothetical protein